MERIEPQRWWRWVVLADVAAIVLLLLWWAVSKGAVCAATYPAQGSCTQGLRVLPAAIGLIVTLVLTLTMGLLLAFARPSVRASAYPLGVVLIAVSGVIFTLVTLFSAEFSLP
jgi:hypothetical protein